MEQSYLHDNGNDIVKSLFFLWYKKEYPKALNSSLIYY